MILGAPEGTRTPTGPKSTGFQRVDNTGPLATRDRLPFRHGSKSYVGTSGGFYNIEWPIPASTRQASETLNLPKKRKRAKMSRKGKMRRRMMTSRQPQRPEPQPTAQHNETTSAVSNDHARETQQEQSRWQLIRPYFRDQTLSIFSLIVSVFAAIYAYQQAKIAQQALVIGQRAFVHLENIDHSIVDNWVSELETNGKLMVFNAPRNIGKMIRSKFLFTNAGNTPTKSLQIMIHCDLVGPSRQIDDPFDLLKWNDAKVILRSIGAKQTIAVSNDSCDFKNNDVLLNAQMRVVRVLLAGELTYQDWADPGPIHRTEFGHQLVVNDPGRGNDFTGMSVTTEPIGKHNCTDSDCPK